MLSFYSRGIVSVVKKYSSFAKSRSVLLSLARLVSEVLHARFWFLLGFRFWKGCTAYFSHVMLQVFTHERCFSSLVNWVSRCCFFTHLCTSLLKHRRRLNPAISARPSIHILFLVSFGITMAITTNSLHALVSLLLWITLHNACVHCLAMISHLSEAVQENQIKSSENLSLTALKSSFIGLAFPYSCLTYWVFCVLCLAQLLLYVYSVCLLVSLDYYAY